MYKNLEKNETIHISQKRFSRLWLLSIFACAMLQYLQTSNFLQISKSIKFLPGACSFEIISPHNNNNNNYYYDCKL